MGNILRLDSFRSFLAGFGGPKDKAKSMHAVLELIGPEQLEALYRSDWVSKKVVDIPPFDACRAWRSWEADKEQAAALTETEKTFGLQRKLLQALIKSRLYGGSVIVIGIKGQKFEEELDLDSVGKGDLVFAHVVERWQISAGPLVRDITSPWFGQPSYYQRSNVVTAPVIELKPELQMSALGYKPGEMIMM